MATAFPIPSEAFDDRLAFVGTTGSGKTYTAGTVVERILDQKGRVVIVDPLGVWYGLRLQPDGKNPSRFNPIIFGGPHGDLPISEISGALIGETVAGMAESCIIDLTGIGTKNGERRFMLPFLTALYRKTNGEPLHLILDEADMFAPQKLDDKEADAAKLLGMVETIVRRGRIKGFIPWLITQRPAVLNKNVLSQADALVAMKLTGEHDRNAIKGWIEGNADPSLGKELLGSLASKQIGQGLVWIPGRGILEHASFPTKTTFDSSRTPKRGEKKSTATLKPIDLGSLKDRLASIEQETKANDPKALKAEIAKLRNEAIQAGKLRNAPVNNFTHTEADVKAAYDLGRSFGVKSLNASIDDAIGSIESALTRLRFTKNEPKQIPAKTLISSEDRTGRSHALADARKREAQETQDPSDLTNAQRKVLASLAWWESFGHKSASRSQVAAICGWSANSSNIRDRSSELKSKGLVTYPASETLQLTDEGRAAAPSTDISDGASAILRPLSNAQRKLVEVLRRESGSISKGDLALACEWSPDSSNIRDRCSELKTLDYISYPESGHVALTDWAREVLA